MASICFDESLLAADEAGFSGIAHGQYAIFIALRSCEPATRAEVSNGKKCLKVFQTIQNQGK
jgi:hypothetical protein